MFPRNLGRNGLLALVGCLVAVFARPSYAAEASDLHVLLVADTNADKKFPGSQISTGLQVDVETMKQVIDEVYAANLPKFKGHVFVDVLEGDDVSPDKIREYYRSRPHTKHPVTSSSSLFFYYCGHGAWDRQRGQHFTTSGGDMLRAEVRDLMCDLRPKSVILISDCCSSFHDFKPPERNRPAKWKAFHHLFFETDGIVDFTAATESQFGWVSAAHGGMFTKALTNWLCDPRIDETEDWSKFFARVRDTTDKLFQEAKAAAADGALIKKSAAQRPESFYLGTWKKEFRRQLFVRNNTGERLCVWLQYRDVNFSTNIFQWYYPTNDKTKFYEMAPGQQTFLNYNGSKIGAQRIRIWASSLDSKSTWEKYKDEDYELAPRDGYIGSYETGPFTFGEKKVTATKSGDTKSGDTKSGEVRQNAAR